MIAYSQYKHTAEIMIVNFLSQRALLILSFSCVALFSLQTLIRQFPNLSLSLIFLFLVSVLEIRKQVLTVTTIPFKTIQPANHFLITNFIRKPFLQNNKF
jgi:hypothetical protein